MEHKELTRAACIAECLALWEWVAQTGIHKAEWPEWERVRREYNLLFAGWCPFCEYANSQVRNTYDRCGYCPYYKHFGHTCMDPRSPYLDIVDLGITKERVNAFLEQLREIPVEKEATNEVQS